MKKLFILILLLLTSTTLFARITKENVVGNWELVSKDHYLMMVFNRKGYVKITEGDSKHKPKLLPLGMWAATDGVLKITIYGKTKFIYSHIKFEGKTITVRNSRGKTERFRFTPPTE